MRGYAHTYATENEQPNEKMINRSSFLFFFPPSRTKITLLTNFLNIRIRLDPNPKMRVAKIVLLVSISR